MNSQAVAQSAEEVSAEVDRVAFEAGAIGESEAPARILVAPWGEVRSEVGSFVVDAESARATLAAFEAHGTDLPIDYEHQTLGGAFSSPSGQAPAAGWIKRLSVVLPEEAAAAGCEPGLWGEVEWTMEAAGQLRQRKYRYLSPVALVRRRDRRLVGLHSAALTNKPAIVGMRPLVNRAGSAEAAPEDETMERALPGLRGLLGVDEGAADDVVVLAAVDRIRTLERAADTQRAEEKVRRASAVGRLTTGQREWALALALRDPTEFDAWLACAPVVVSMGRMTGGTIGSAGSAGRQRVSTERAARAEWRANRAMLEPLCSEEAYAADAMRQARGE